MSGFGLLPFGDSAPWGGPGLLSLITILAVGTNELIAFFTVAPKCRDPLGYRDTRNPEMWAIEAVDPAVSAFDGELIIPPGKRRPTIHPWIGECFVDSLDPTQVHIRTVPSLEPGIEYDVTLAGSVRGARCEEFGGVATFRVQALNRPQRARSRFAAVDTYRDWANPFGATPDGELATGTWLTESNGETVLSDAAASLKERVTRRLITSLGGFAHLPAYGLQDLSKKMIRPRALQDFAVRIQEQLRREPDVRDAAVSATLELGKGGGGILRFQVRVQARSIGEVSFLVQVPAGGL
ncbi:MAG TPA: hypothetical protein VM869_35775 [Enhygromyxa sp.]|nr:hypothetical protein [Enhygromyxa sp.]